MMVIEVEGVVGFAAGGVIALWCDFRLVGPPKLVLTLAALTVLNFCKLTGCIRRFGEPVQGLLFNRTESRCLTGNSLKAGGM